MKYKEGYKYILVEDEVTLTPIKGFTVNEKFISLDGDGKLTVRAFYAWDGASGPTRDDKTNMRGSAIHDAFYQLMRQGWIPLSFRDKVDALFETMCKADKMGKFRAWYYHKGVQWFGKKSAEVQGEVILTAP